MIRSVLIFLGTFALGALVALIARASLHDPHADRPTAPAAAEYVPMVDNSLAPAATASEQDAHAAAAKVKPHAEHGESAAKNPATPGKPVNTVCAICGMDVDPALPTATYQGQTIGFGCRMCPPKFKADPDLYGPYYLRNEVIER